MNETFEFWWKLFNSLPNNIYLSSNENLSSNVSVLIFFDETIFYLLYEVKAKSRIVKSILSKVSHEYVANVRARVHVDMLS